ncbi:TVP38/TMEM64 family protein [Paenibacillus tepidiphilus]|uniref:TVP38/TMEM64 family protein n=1 Tax=Paenibacillus tepidiphilus TaxID=2608683 RepID=UPI00123AC55F|nr:VTT domain-containing protein [Paenibacillus tepidiphilus]
MTTHIVELLGESGYFAIILSLVLNILISIFAFIPSVFLTGANITLFGFLNGMMISFFGEVLGAIVSFVLYRRGFLSLIRGIKNENKYLKRLQQTSGYEAFFLILALRILPFIPSGLVNISSSVSRVSWVTFGLATMLGKLPALVIEAYSIQQLLILSKEYLSVALILVSIVLILIIFTVNKRRHTKYRD